METAAGITLYFRIIWNSWDQNASKPDFFVYAICVYLQQNYAKRITKGRSNFHKINYTVSGFIGHTIQMLNLMLLLFQTAKKKGLESRDKAPRNLPYPLQSRHIYHELLHPQHNVLRPRELFLTNTFVLSKIMQQNQIFIKQTPRCYRQYYRDASFEF